MKKAELHHNINMLKNELEKSEIILSVAELRGIPKDMIKAEIKALKSKITKSENLLGKMK